ncbi:MAG TPA: formate dehydrogenase accessory sulfurtransferase FdhD [Candidatus Acidoferrum sp.]|nr:formate dehydrogenase accessory sulfurtransferase FdhD [Candidatus Acidoferrum sp.]
MKLATSKCILDYRPIAKYGLYQSFLRTNIRYDGAEYSDYDDVAVEDTITLFLNDIRIATLVASPDMLRELCIGYLLSEGVVTNFD